MAQRQARKKAATTNRTAGKASNGFTAEEKAAMRERAKEIKAAERRAASDAEGESDVRSKLAEMGKADRVIGERIHAIVKASAPGVSPRTWYGMPAYAVDGKVLCFFKAAAKFKTRYATLGFSDQAKLDDGAMWATDYALRELTPEVEARIAALVRQALG
jgi:uncharacterized protein YdhG (YjbR/CyaY superfamily)